MTTSLGPAVSSVVAVTSAFRVQVRMGELGALRTPVVPDVYRMTASSSSFRLGPVQSAAAGRRAGSARPAPLPGMTWAPVSAAPLAASSAAIGPRRR